MKNRVKYKVNGVIKTQICFAELYGKKFTTDFTYYPEIDIDKKTALKFLTLIKEIEEVSPLIDPEKIVQEKQWTVDKDTNGLLIFLILTLIRLLDESQDAVHLICKLKDKHPKLNILYVFKIVPPNCIYNMEHYIINLFKTKADDYYDKVKLQNGRDPASLTGLQRGLFNVFKIKDSDAAYIENENQLKALLKGDEDYEVYC